MLTKNNIKSDELYKSLFKNCYSVMLIIHPETGEILDANTSACNFYKYKKSEITNMFIQDINTLSKEQVCKEMKNAKLENRNYFNFCHKLANGEVRDVEVFSGPITIRQEKVLYSIVHDVTARKLVEKQIEYERKFSESLINSLPGIMYLFDEMGDFKRWNKNFQLVTGFSAKEILNMNPLDIISSEDKEKVGNRIKDVFNEGRASIEAKIFTKDGQIIPYHFTGAKLVVDGVKFLVGIGLDITERKQIENEKENLIEKLHDALSQVKQLSGFLPICASCKKIRDDNGYWNQIESYIKEHSEAEFSHSICPDCAKKLYPDLVDENGNF